MRLTAPSDLFHRSLHGRPPRVAALLAIATALTLPAAAFGQQTPTGGDDTDAAMRNIQNNFAHMTPAPRTIDTINQELKQNAKARGGGGGGGGFGQHGGGRHGGGRQASQQDKSTDSNNGASPGTGATPPESSALSNGVAPQ